MNTFKHKQVQAQHADQSATLLRLGTALQAQGRYDEAAARFREAICLDPNGAEAHFHLGNHLRARGQWSEAAGCYQQVIRLLPGFPLAHYNLGTAFVANRQPVQAMDCFRRALRLEPTLAPAHAALGDLLLEKGNREDAISHFREALRHDPACVPALVSVTWHGLYPLSKPQRNRMMALLADPHLQPYDGARLHFGLANEHDRAGAYDEAFAHFRQANTLRRRVLREAGKVFDASWYHGWIDQIIATCDTAYFRRTLGIGRATERPVFIVGMPRSGTSLIEQILASHPDVFGAGERQEIGQMVAGLMSQAPGEEYPSLARQDGTMIGALADWYLQRIERLDKTAARVTDKTPNNFQFLGLIAALFPQARVIHCRRDPADVCFSCYIQDFKEWTLDLEELASYYRDYERLMSHWQSVLPLALLEVAYEDMVDDPESVSRRLISFCGLNWDERCLAYDQNPRAVRTASILQVRRPVYKTSVGRWRRYAAHLRPLLEGLGRPMEG
jgi:tetratricopeptide (TPR) repeat protein